MERCERSEQLVHSEAEVPYLADSGTRFQDATSQASEQCTNASEPCTSSVERRHGGKKRSRERKFVPYSTDQNNNANGGDPEEVAVGSLPMGIPSLISELNIDLVRSKLAHWQSLLPHVVPHFSSWCSAPDRELLQLLRDEGCSFACSNAEEVLRLINLGTPLQIVVLAQPCATRMHLRCMKRWGVNLLSFFTAAQLRKTALEFPHARLVLNVALGSPGPAGRSSALVPRCGAGRDEWRQLLALAKELKLRIVGIALQPLSPAARLGLCRGGHGLATALHVAREVFDLALEYDFRVELLDLGTSIGDALDGATDDHIPQSALQIAPLLEKHFPRAEHQRLRILAELAGFLRRCSSADAGSSALTRPSETELMCTCGEEECAQNVSESASSCEAVQKHVAP